MRQGARPCGAGSPGRAGLQAVATPPDYKSQERAGPPPAPRSPPGLPPERRQRLGSGAAPAGEGAGAAGGGKGGDKGGSPTSCRGVWGPRGGAELGDGELGTPRAAACSLGWG